MKNPISLLKPVRDFIFPPLCLLCNESLTEERICRSCWGSFPPADPSHAAWKNLQRIVTREGVDDLFASFLFEKEGKLKDALHLLKYSEKRSIGLMFGREIGAHIAFADALVPVPLHRRKQRERGYNQSEWISLGIAETAKIPLNTSMLVRRKDTPTQTHLDSESRWENLRDAFESCPAVNGKNVILVDDVMTTGSTIAACARALKSLGAARVCAVAAAIATCDL